MGCKHSSSSNSPKLINKHGQQISLKNKIFLQHEKKHTNQNSTNMKKSIHSKTIPLLNLEQILDGHGKSLTKKFEFNSACLLFDVSLTHILLLNDRQLYLINLNTMNIDKNILLTDNIDIQEIVWSMQLNYFLILTTDQLYQINVEQFEFTPIIQMQVRSYFHTKNKRILFC